MRYRLLFICTIFLFAFSPADIFGQLTSNPAGKLDRSFGVGGVSLINPDLTTEGPGATLLLPDGTLFQANTWGINPLTVLVSKQLVNGDLDSNFGQNGLILIQLTGFGYVNSLAIQPDSKLLIAGQSNSTFSNGANDIFLFRLDADGGLDATFGNGGFVWLDFTPAKSELISDDQMPSILVQNDGKLLLACLAEQYVGSSSRNSAYSTIVRLNPNGTIDETFGVSGLSKTLIGSNEINTGQGFLNASFQQDGKIVVGAVADREDPLNPGQYSNRALVLRYLPDGSLDTGFSDDGMIDIAVGSHLLICRTKEISGGKLLSLTINGLVQIAPNGSIDETFGNAGLASLGSGGLPVDFDVAPDDTIFVSRQSNPGGNRTIGRIQKFWPDGTADIRFARNGSVEFDLGVRTLFVGRIRLFQSKYLMVTGVIGLPQNYKPFTARFFATKKL